ncbi:GNAT family N-acetyltransferase [Nonomuraea zeae]|uniref:GNAT family N-acetyltransferase n=2 Tax=Nonomuraea zeae TaxID=1642303 RepID=A0A5S4H4M0_9ACTN|nr:GNAT family N-acetyltransferase [Nonomuraea zeae]
MAIALSDPDLHVFIGGAPLTAQELRARYERLVAGPAGWRNWVIRLRAEDQLIGYVQATIDEGVAELAWVVGTPWQGRGLATESAKALVGWLFTQDVKQVVAHIHPDHGASAAVAAAAGLHPTDQMKDGEVRWEATA